MERGNGMRHVIAIAALAFAGLHAAEARAEYGCPGQSVFDMSPAEAERCLALRDQIIARIEAECRARHRDDGSEIIEECIRELLEKEPF